MLFGVRLLLIGEYGNPTPFWDQWVAEAIQIYQPYDLGTLGLSDLFTAVNQHRILPSRVLSLGIFELNGIWDPVLGMVVNAGLYSLTVAFVVNLFVQVSGRGASPGLVLFALILFGLPYAWFNTLVSFQSPFSFVLLFSAICLWLTVLSAPLSARWWVGVGSGVFSSLSLASGLLAFAAAGTVALAVYALGGRRTIQQAWSAVTLVSLTLVFVWLLPAVDAPPKQVGIMATGLLDILSWPGPGRLWFAVAVYAPAAYFLISVVRRAPRADHKHWFLVAFIFWACGQALAVAYGRAPGVLGSRHLDLYAVGVLVNFVCLLALLDSTAGRKRVIAVIAMMAWSCLILICLSQYHQQKTSAELTLKRTTASVQEINTASYIRTGDLSYLHGKRHLEVPFPNGRHLGRLLDDPYIRSILPSNIRPPLQPAVVGTPPGAFVESGYYPGTPERRWPVYGSYGETGNHHTGTLELTFPGVERNGLIEIPLAGFPLGHPEPGGMEIVVEQAGAQRQLLPSENPRQTWQQVRVEVAPGPFSIRVHDNSSTAWVAVGLPKEVGAFSALGQRFIDHFAWFIALGFSVLLGGFMLRSGDHYAA